MLLSFSESLNTKCVSINDEQYMVRPTLVDLNLVDLRYYPLILSIHG